MIAVVAWMAGLFYLPRLLVYHVESSHQATQDTLRTHGKAFIQNNYDASHVCCAIFGLFVTFYPWVPSIWLYAYKNPLRFIINCV